MVRAKQRYILCEVVPGVEHKTNQTIEQEEIYKAVKAAINQFHGDYAAGIVQRSLSVKYCNNETNIVLIRVKRGAQKMVIQSMALMKKIGEVEAMLKTLHVSGTIRSCQKYLVKHQKKELIMSLRRCQATAGKKQLRKLIQDCEQSCQERAHKQRKRKPFFALSTDSSDEDSDS